MPDNVSKTFHDEEATSRTSSQACQPSWMSHWSRRNSEVASRVNGSSLIYTKDNLVDLGGKSVASPSTLNMANGFSKYGKGLIKDPKEMVFGMLSETKKHGHFKCETSDHDFGDKNLSLALALGRGETSKDLNLPHESILRSNKTHFVSHLLEEKKGVTMSKTYTQKNASSALCLPPLGSEKEDTSSPVVVFERHFSNDNFTCFGKDNCKYKKYSSLLVHETNMKNDLSDELRHDGHHAKQNFQAFFSKKQSNTLPSHQSHSPDNIPYSVRNFETTRICTMVDSMEDSQKGYHKISQRAHHVLFTKETCANLPSHCEEKTFGPINVSHVIASFRASGVKIQPLWTSTDSEEKENTGNSSVFKAGSKNEASVGTNSMQDNAPQSRHNLSGRTSSSLHKDNTVDENSSPAAYDSRMTEKTKRLLLEIPDINEQLPGLQPAVSSTDDDEPSTSRVHSLNTKHLFPNKKRALTGQDDSVSPEASIRCPEPGNRWIKRLKLNSSDSLGVGSKTSDGEGSSHQKFNMYFNRIMKSSRESLDSKLNKHHGKDENQLGQNLESVVSDKRNHSMNGCSWIQRWCQNSTVSQPKNPEPLVICEPHSLKFGHDEVAKKQFPSIGALALMGKAVNGYHSCEFSKRGSVVVWNTREF